MKSKFALRLLPLCLLGLAGAPLALAHPGHGPSVGFAAGFAHPLGGWDHVLAMAAVGLWAARPYARCLIPGAFLVMMTVGAAAGHWTGAVPGGEQFIAASVLAFGLLTADAVRLPSRVSIGLTGFFALFHGAAHGAEMPATAAGLAYGAGFVAATILLMAAGVGLGELAGRKLARVPQFAGWVVAAAGAVMLVLSFTPGSVH